VPNGAGAARPRRRADVYFRDLRLRS